MDANLAIGAIGSLGAAGGALAAWKAAAAAVRAAKIAEQSIKSSMSIQRATLATEVWLRLDERFASARMIELRIKGASKWLENGELNEELEELIDFFDFIGTLVRLERLEMEMAWSSFFEFVQVYWHVAREAVAIEQTASPETWADFAYLYERLMAFDLRRKRAIPRELADDHLKSFFESERDLPRGRVPSAPAGRSPYGSGNALTQN